MCRDFNTKKILLQGNFFKRRSLANMGQVIITFKRSYKFFLAVTAMLAIQFVSAGKIALLGAILIGAILNFFWFISSAARLEVAAQKNSAQAKRIMLIGLLLRLGMVFIVLAVAAHISAELFLSTAACLITYYIASLCALIYFGRRSY